MAATNLTNKANLTNTRRVLVNAQVKAMISFLESFSNILYVIMVWFTVRTSFVTLLQIMTLYFVFLPYSFLMNTSHNKNRVVEIGWKNVFRNILGIKWDTTACKEEDSRTQDTLACKDKVAKVREELQPTQNDRQNDLNNKNAPKVFAIASGITSPNPSKNAWLTEEPPTSKITEGKKLRKRLSVNQLLKETKRNTVHNIEYKDPKHFNDSEKYFDYFTKIGVL